MLKMIMSKIIMLHFGRKIEKYNSEMYSGKALFSVLFPPDFYYTHVGKNPAKLKSK